MFLAFANRGALYSKVSVDSLWNEICFESSFFGSLVSLVHFEVEITGADNSVFFLGD